MNIQKLEELLRKNNLYIKQTQKNIVAICPVCGDHPDPNKKGHLYISTNPDFPVYHCFFQDCKGPIIKLVKDLTGNDKKIIKEIGIQDNPQVKNKTTKFKLEKKRSIKFQIPSIEHGSFLNKRFYIKARTGKEPEEIGDLIFNFSDFFNRNNLNNIRNHYINDNMFDELHNKFVGFLTKHHTKLICRRTNNDCNFKFMKFDLQCDKFSLLDYYNIKGGNPNSDTIVLAEGPFDVLKESSNDTLGIKNSVRLYASGQSFSYSALLKSVCFDEQLFRVKVIILSDRDKDEHYYNKFKYENRHILKSVKIFYNKLGKDFGSPKVKSFQGLTMTNSFKKIYLRRA